MFTSLRNFTRRSRQRFYYRLLPKLVDSLAEAATRQSLRKLSAANAGRVLVDNSVLAHAVTHETAWIRTGKSWWGGKHEIETGYSARIPVHRDDDTSEQYRSIRFLPGIASLARRGHLRLALSDELRDEQFTQPLGRFRGYGYFDYSLLSGVQFDRIEDPDYAFTIGPSWMGFPSHKEQRKQRLDAKTDPAYRALVDVLGSSNSQDAWHIATAEKNHCYCFLTMDFSLLRNVRAQANNIALRSLTTKILSPEEFGRAFAIRPMPPRWFSYHHADCFVVHTTNWPDSRRCRPKKS